MTAQLPGEAVRTAVGVLIWSFLCLSCSGLMAWLTWVHHERTSYVALFAYLPALATSASIAQQLHTIVRWRDVKTEQHYHSMAHIREPEVAVAGGSVGADLVLFYIQFYCYNTMALLVLAWAASLTQSMYRVRRLNLAETSATNAAKIISLLLPVVFLGILQVDAVQHSTLAFLIIANILMAIGMAGATALLLAILAKYVRSKVVVSSRNGRYGTNSATRLTDAEISASGAKRNIYDQWLLFRFTLAVIAISAFEVFVIIFEVSSARQNQEIVLKDSLDLSAERAHGDLVNFMSGVSPGLLAFLTFGTTKALRAYMWERFVPRFLKNGLRRKRSHDDTIQLC